MVYIYVNIYLYIYGWNGLLENLQRYIWKSFAHHKQLWQVGNLANIIIYEKPECVCTGFVLNRFVTTVTS